MGYNLDTPDEFSNKAYETLDKLIVDLTSLMEQLKEELRYNDNETIKKALPSIWSSQSQLIKARSWLSKSYKIPPDAVESWQHFRAKNKIANKLRLSSKNIFYECSFGKMRFDIIAKTCGEYVIIEAETVPPKCIEKMERIGETISNLASNEKFPLEADSVPVFSEIRKQLQKNKPMRIIFVVTKKPAKLTLESIKKTETPFVRPELYHVDTSLRKGVHPFKITRYL